MSPEIYLHIAAIWLDRVEHLLAFLAMTSDTFYISLQFYKRLHAAEA